jgi:hypothetical protein
MKKKTVVIAIAVICLLLLLRSCVIRTPEIHGTVIDAETKQPVEGAWITGGLTLKSITIAGDVTSYPSVERPHTRTGKDGKFIIPSRTFMRILIPIRLYTKVDSFGIAARTADWRGGGANLTNSLWKWKTNVTIAIDKAEKDDIMQIAGYVKGGMTKEKAEELVEQDYFSSLQALYSYCISGRFSVEVPTVQEGCDDWELDYVIKKHEWYLGRYEEAAKAGKAKGYFIAMEQLSELYEKKKDYRNAAEQLKKSIRIMEIRGLLKHEAWQKDRQMLEDKIKKLLSEGNN